MDEPRISLTNSQAQTFLRCRRKWFIDYYLRRTPITDERKRALSIGTIVHEALAAYYGGQTQDPVYVLNRALQQEREKYPNQLEDIERDEELCHIMVDGYLQWVKMEGADEGLEIIGPEMPVEIDLRDEVTLRGILDVRVRRQQDGAVLFIDHKTRAAFDTIDKLQQDRQMLTYHVLERVSLANAPRTDGAIYNMLRKVKRGTRAKPPFYMRAEIHHNVHELRAHWVQMVQIAEEMLALMDQLDRGEHWRVMPHPTRDCSWDCPHFSTGLCLMMDDGSDWERMLENEYAPFNPDARYEVKDTDT